MKAQEHGWPWPMAPQAFTPIPTSSHVNSSGIIIPSSRQKTGEDTPTYRAWTEALGEIKPYTDLLVKLQRQEQSVAKADDFKVEVSTFVARPAKEEDVPRTYLIVMNTNWTKERTFNLTCSLRGKIYDLEDGRELSDEELGRLALPPGSGQIFRVE